MKTKSLLIQLLFMSWESIQRVACGSLCELANDKDSIELIEKESITDRLTELLRSKDEALATYSAAILFRLSEDKPQQQQHQPPHSRNLSDNTAAVQYNNALNAYELEMKQHNEMINQMDNQQMTASQFNNSIGMQQQQQPSTWFDTDL